MTIEIKKLSDHNTPEFVELIRIFEDVFEMENFSIPDIEHLEKVLSKPDFIVMIAMVQNEIVGGLTAYVLHQYYSQKPLAYIYDLAIKRSYQRQGIGKLLISGFNSYCKEKDFEEVFVQADKVDDYAIDFYRATGITAEEQVIHFYYSLAK
jgi:aminoglycoside 3-N-acetyltransferase I